MLSFVTFYWQGGRNAFTPDHVNTLKRMVGRHYDGEHRFICVTSLPDGLDDGIEIVEDVNDFDTARPDIDYFRQYPEQTCYRRLRLYRRDAGEIFGLRICSLDLDVVITGDLTDALDPLDDIVLLAGPADNSNPYNGSVQLLTAGARPQVFETFDPETSPGCARAEGFGGTDQAWLAHCLGPDEATFTEENGFYSWRMLKRNGGSLPEGARLVSFAGRDKPWSDGVKDLEWVREYYK